MSPAAGEVAGARGEGGGVEARRVFIGAGCNRVVNNVSWGACGLVAFGAQNAVALFSPQRGEIVTTLPGHKAPVNCTLWLPTKKDVLHVRGRETYYLLSGSADGAILAWKIGSGKGDVSLFCFHLTIIPYFCSVTYVDVLHHSSVVLGRVAVAVYLLRNICLINMKFV